MKKFITYTIIAILIFSTIGILVNKDKIVDRFTKTEYKIEYVPQPPDTVYKDSLIVKWRKYTVIDSAGWDSLYSTIGFYESILDSMLKGFEPIITDTTKFESGDSLITEIGFLPKFWINYYFYPRPDKNITETIINNDIISKTSLLTLHLGGGLNYNSSKYSETGTISELNPELMIGCSFNKINLMPYYRKNLSHSNNSIGICYNIRLF